MRKNKQILHKRRFLTVTQNSNPSILTFTGPDMNHLVPIVDDGIGKSYLFIVRISSPGPSNCKRNNTPYWEEKKS